VWHIGTGQSSDSLAWGDDHGTLAALRILARRYPEKVIELKTKSARTDWITDDWPRNIIATWSLNAPVIQQAEEHFTASIAERIKAARIAADHHILVGFHFHPMVWFDGWQEGYRQVVEMVTSSFRPEEVALVSFGTLTFTKSVLKTLREAGRPIPDPGHGSVTSPVKFSYPWETKRDLFCERLARVSRQLEDRARPFFYPCFEDPTHGQPVFGPRTSFQRGVRSKQ
jgi:spore photoproduct lyase